MLMSNNTNSEGWETTESSNSQLPPLPKSVKKKTNKKKKPKKKSSTKSKRQITITKPKITVSSQLPIPSNNSNSDWVTTEEDRLSSTPDNSTVPLTSKYHRIKYTITQNYEVYEQNPVIFLDTFLKASREQPDKFVTNIQDYNNNSKFPLTHKFFIIKMTIPTTSRSKTVHNTTFCLMTNEGVFPIDYLNVNDTVDPFSELQVKKGTQKLKGMKSLLKGLRVAGAAICSHEIGKGYITEQYTDYSTIGVISFGLHKRNTRGISLNILDVLKDISLVNKFDVLGFVYCEPYKSYPIDAYIPLICSNKNFGGVLLKFIENLASYIGYDKMQLSAIDTAVSYYYFKSNYKIKKGGKHTIPFNYKLSRFIKRPIEGSVKTKGGDGENINRIVLTTPLTKKYSVHPGASRVSKRIKVLQETAHKEYTIFNVAADDDDNIKMAKNLDRY